MAASLEMRAALRAVPLVTRKTWAVQHGELCQLCARFGKEGELFCSYPSHWNGARLRRAFDELCRVDPEQLEFEPVADRHDCLD